MLGNPSSIKNTSLWIVLIFRCKYVVTIELLKNITLYSGNTFYTTLYKRYVMRQQHTQKVGGNGGWVRMPHSRLFLSIYDIAI